MFEANLFQGQRVLITGGGTGLGLAMAAKLAELGAELHLCGRRHSVVQQACEMLNNDTGAQAFAHELDIRQPEAVHTVIDRIWTEHGPDRKSTRLNSSHSQISYAVFCLKKKKNTTG